MLPVNLYRLTQDFNNGELKGKTDLTIDVLDGINDILNDYEYRLLTYNDKKNKILEDENYFKTMLKVALDEYLF